MRHRRAVPGDFEGRLLRATSISVSKAASEPLTFLTAVLTHQARRSALSEIRETAAAVGADILTKSLTQEYPLLTLQASSERIVSELEPAIENLQLRAPLPLQQAGGVLLSAPDSECTDLVGLWLDDPSVVDPRLAVWMKIAAAPVLELAAARAEPPSKEEWAGRACPMCGDVPQCSVIVEESGAFLQGSPRYLVCARCATWWGFSRATCPCCGEDDSRRITPFTGEEEPWVRIDACETCHGYVKTFDLREKGAVQVVPIVDDVTSLALDVWAHEAGFERPAFSLAGV